jgi:hypothetical protein
MCRWFFDIDPAMSDWFEGVRMLQQAPRGFFRIGVRTIGSVFHRSGTCPPQLRMVYFRSVQSRWSRQAW